MYYTHKITKDEWGNEITRITGKPVKTYEKALIRAKKLQNALIYRFPNKPVSLIRNSIEVLST
jgi:hypothetical protein